MSSTPAIRLAGLTAGYHADAVLTDIDCTIADGGMTAILGPNGAGKTTLLRVMTGRLRPQAGSVELFGEPVARIPPRRRAELIGVVPQAIDLPVAFRVEEVVMLGRTARLDAWRGPGPTDRAAVEQAMVFTDVDHLAGQPFSELSGGERQRVMIAMVLAQAPRILLLDEATSHLDINHRLEIMQIVERLNHTRGVTVIAISHDLNLAAEYCPRLLLLHRGRIAADGTPSEVLDRRILKTVYQCDVCIARNPASGSVSVMPAPRLVAEADGTGRHVHVICGGGSGDELLRRLTLGSYQVTAGVLNRGDSDGLAAQALGIECVVEAAFAPISDTALEAARRLAAGAEAVIIAAVPFGSGNTANLAIAEDALRRGATVYIQAFDGPRDYTPDRAADHRLAALSEAGAITVEDLPALIDRLAGHSLVDGVPRDLASREREIDRLAESACNPPAPPA